LHCQDVIPVSDAGDLAGEVARQDGPAECLGQQGHADRFQVGIEIQLGVGAEAADVECVDDQGAIENGKPRVVRERKVVALRRECHLHRSADQSIGAAGTPGELGLPRGGCCAPVQLTVRIGERQSGGGIGHADVLDPGVAGGQRIVRDVYVACGATADIECAEVRRGQGQLQKAPVGRREFQPLNVEVGPFDCDGPRPSAIRALPVVANRSFWLS